jgi:thiol-disulfide isomerase/thioredoxin
MMLRLIRWLAIRSIAFAVIALVTAASATAAEFKPFTAQSTDTIRAAHAGKPFVLAFWSIYCEPCRDEMAVWKATRSRHPEMPIVLVATDPLAEHGTMKRFLAQYDPGSVELFAFADEFSERVRFAVDRTWRGELPRAYFFDATGRSEAHSGLVDNQWVESWIGRQRNAIPR